MVDFLRGAASDENAVVVAVDSDSGAEGSPANGDLDVLMSSAGHRLRRLPAAPLRLPPPGSGDDRGNPGTTGRDQPAQRADVLGDQVSMLEGSPTIWSLYGLLALVLVYAAASAGRFAHSVPPRSICLVDEDPHCGPQDGAACIGSHTATTATSNRPYVKREDCPINGSGALSVVRCVDG